MFLIVFKAVFDLKLNFKQKVDPNMCTFKNLENILKIRVATLKIARRVTFARVYFLLILIFIFITKLFKILFLLLPLTLGR